MKEKVCYTCKYCDEKPNKDPCLDCDCFSNWVDEESEPAKSVEFKRLTYSGTREAILSTTISQACGRLSDYEDSGLTPKEVTELAKAKAEGRLYIVPIKISSLMFCANENYDYDAEKDLFIPGITEGICEGYAIMSNGLSNPGNEWGYEGLEGTYYDWKKTRAEAEKALEEKKND